jgi:hypothetical protein
MFRNHFLGWLLMATLTCGLHAQPSAETEDIREPKALVEIPAEKKSALGMGLGLGSATLLLAFAAYRWRYLLMSRWLKSPSDLALLSFIELEASATTLDAEAFANRAALTVRTYIASRFNLAAPRQTTEEFLRELAKESNAKLIGESLHLQSFLKSCDLAKFAGANLDSKQRGELIQTARNFIQATSKAVAP